MISSPSTSSQSCEVGGAIQVTPQHRENRGSPLSTKRERIEQTPRVPCVPKIVRSAPSMRSVLKKREEITARMVTPDGTKQLESPRYNRTNPGSFFEQVFEILKVIGRGAFGEVFSVQSREDSRFYAVKVSMAPIRQHSLSKYHEAESHMMIPPHRNLVKFYRAWEEAERLFIQTELCDQSLQSFCEVNHVISMEQIWNIFVDLLQAVHHLHSNELIHDDIKPDNVFLTKDMISKLGDFGLLVNLRNPSEVKSAEEGDSKYLAPEVLNSHPTKASDLFSLGVTILEAATDMDVPSSGDAWHQIRNGQIPDKFFIGVCPELRGIIEALLHREPERRPSTGELMRSPVVKEKIQERNEFIAMVEVNSLMQPSTPILTPATPSRAYEQSMTGSAIRQYEEQCRRWKEVDLEPPRIGRLKLDLGDDDENEEEKPVRRGALPTSSRSRRALETQISSQPSTSDAPPTPSLHLNQLLTEEERTARYERIRANEILMDQNDLEDTLDERPPPKSCPSRVRIRMGKTVPRMLPLDFSKLG